MIWRVLVQVEPGGAYAHLAEVDPEFRTICMGGLARVGAQNYVPAGRFSFCFRPEPVLANDLVFHSDIMYLGKLTKSCFLQASE